MEAYAAACVTEVGRAVEREGMPAATSVFFGGGTPSRLPADLLVEVLDAVPRRPGAEVTVECNPEDVTDERLATYRAAGVTRISLGVQSTVGHVLEGLGRRHGPAQVTEAAALVAAAGFASWNLDLILGGAGERDEDWERSLADLLGLASPPPHLSAYALTVEPGTPLAAAPGAAPRRRRPGRPLRGGRPGARPPPATGGRRSPTGPGPATSAGTTTSTGSRATTGGSARRPTPTGPAAGGGTSAPRTATWPWCGDDRSDGGRRGGARRRPAGRRGAWPWRCARRPACRSTRCPTTPTSRGWSTARRGGPC